MLHPSRFRPGSLLFAKELGPRNIAGVAAEQVLDRLLELTPCTEGNLR